MGFAGCVTNGIALAIKQLSIENLSIVLLADDPDG